MRVAQRRYPATIYCAGHKLMPLEPGARLGPYDILQSIGAGGMGEVYRARDPRLQRDIAIKVLPALAAAEADRVSRFEREAMAVSALNHPNILHIYDIGESGGLHYIAMELPPKKLF